MGCGHDESIIHGLRLLGRTRQEAIEELDRKQRDRESDELWSDLAELYESTRSLIK